MNTLVYIENIQRLNHSFKITITRSSFNYDTCIEETHHDNFTSSTHYADLIPIDKIAVIQKAKQFIEEQLKKLDEQHTSATIELNSVD